MPVHLTLKLGLIILFSKADSATIGFIVEPGEYNPERVLLISGLRGLFLINSHSSLLIPNKNKFGS